jgi:transcriptional regulator with AAA-type ATPase domain
VSDPSTLPITTGRSREDGPPQRPHLFVVMQCTRLGDGPARFSLADVDEVEIGRGDTWQVERISKSLGHCLSIRVPDPTMSGKHARLLKALGRWMIEDAGSRNGTRVDGEAIDRAALPDGAWFDAGHTLFRFRAAIPTLPDDPPDHLLGQTSSLPGLDTLLPPYARELAKLARVAPSELPIVLQGETGVGKEVLASAVHRLSGRPGQFVAINCGAIPEHLVESELFGHRKGAFTGADSERPGLVRASDGGTLFLDEIGDLVPSSQAALLRVLQEREVRPVGGTRSVPVDLRVVAATHDDLGRLVEAGTFRQDLHARLMGYTLAVPPLRERKEDLGLLVRSLLSRGGTNTALPELTIAAARTLGSYDWPLNIRELERCLSAAAVLAGDGPIEVDHLPPQLHHRPAAPTGASGLKPEDAWLREELITRMTEHKGNISAVARSFGKARVQIQRWLKRFELDADAFRE